MGKLPAVPGRVRQLAGSGCIGVYAGGCIALFGSGPQSEGAVLERMPAGSIADLELAARIGASLVVGLKEDLERFPVGWFEGA